MSVFQKILVFVLLLSFVLPLSSADYYWIGGSGNWSDLSHWATSSGGNVTHQQIPTSEDDVFFDANSFTADGQVVEINGNLAFCRKLDFSGTTNNPVFRTAGNNTLNIFGSVLMIPNLVVEINGSIQLSGDLMDNTLDFQKAAVAGNFFVEGDGSWTLTNDVSIQGKFFLNRGSLHLDNFTLTTGLFHSHSTAPRELYWEQGTIIVERGSDIVGDINNPSNEYSIELYSENWNSISGNGTLILNHPESKILIQSKEIRPSDPGGTVIFDDINVTSDIGLFEIINWFDQTEVEIRDLRLNHNSYILTEAKIRDVYLSPGYRYLLHEDSDFEINNLFANGRCETPITLKSASVGQTTRVSFQEEVNIKYVELGDIHVVSGVGNVLNGTDRGNNVGWNIMERETSDYYWIGNEGVWSNPLNWSLSSGGPPAGCIPTSSDNVFFDENSFSLENQSITINIPDAACRSMDWSDVTNNPSLEGDGTRNLSISGSLYFSSNMSNKFEGRVSFVGGEQALEVFSDGNSFNSDVFFENPNGQWTILDDIEVTAALRMVNGHLIFDNVKIDVYEFDSNVVTERIIEFKSSVLNITQFGSTVARARVQMENLTLMSDDLIINTFGVFCDFKIYGEKPVRMKEFNSYSNTSNLETYLFGDGNILTFDNVFFERSGFLLGEIHMDSLTVSGGNFYDLTDGRTHLFLNELILREPCYGIADFYIRRFFLGPSAQITFQESQSVTGFSFRDIVANSDSGEVEVNRGIDAGRNQGFRFIDFIPRVLYWVGGTGQWTDPDHWSLSSGGPSGECAPSSADNIVFDDNSFVTDSDIVLSDSIQNMTCNDFTFSAPETNILFAGLYIKISGSLDLQRKVNWSIFNNRTDGQVDTQFIKTSGTAFQNISIQGRAPVELSDDLILLDSRNFEITTTAPFRSNGFDIKAASFLINIEEGVADIDLDGSTVEITGDANSFYQPFQIIGNPTVQFDNVIFRLTGPNSGIYNEGNASLHNVIFETTSGLMYTYNRNELDFNRFDILGNGLFIDGYTTDSLFFYPSKTYTFAAETTVNINEYWRARGNNCTPIGITSSGVSFKSQVNMPENGEIDFDFVEMRDMEGLGGANFNAGPHSTDIQNSNIGWTFPELDEISEVTGFLGEDLVLCGDESTTISAFSNTPNETYQWNTGSQEAEIEIDASGTFSVLVTFLNGCEIMDEISVIEAAEVELNLPADTVICNDIDFIVDGDINTAGASYAWSNGTMTSSLNITAPGSYLLEVTVGECSAKDSFQVDQVTIENLDLGADISACQGDTVMIGFNENENLSFSWSNGLESSRIMVAEEGLYSVQISSDECSLSDEITVVFNSIPSFSLGEDISICQDSILLLSAPITEAEFRWSDGSTDDMIEVISQGVYDLTVTDDNECTFTDEIEIFVQDLPLIQELSDTSICMGDEITLQLQENNINDQLEWLSSGNDVIMISMAGEYIAQATNNGCISRDTLVVSVLSPPDVDLGIDTTVCSTDAFVLVATQEGASYQWNDGSSESTLSISESGEYAVTVSIGSCSAMDNIALEVVQGPTVNIEGIEEACTGQAIELDAQGNYSTISWNNGETETSILVDESGLYSVNAVDSQGCSAQDSIAVVFNENPDINLATDTLLCDDQQLSLTFSDPDLQYSWSDGVQGNIRNINSPGLYELTVRNEFDCEYRSSINVEFRECSAFSIYVPNAFSPTGNFGNDKFYISLPQNVGVISWNLNIYDRWGNRVFNASDPNTFWDGKWMNAKIKSGVYIYNLEVEYLDDFGVGKERFRGSVTLIE
jgi:gliding motility-associated-like protein